ncbi:MAG: calcium/sodium antiporter [Rhodothermales bacterium]|nr:calcium/sodium antiporter [Rhodothermales bacterium]
MTVVIFITGLAALLVGAELLVRGASRLAASVGISPLVIGLTVVAFGTSAPELAVSVKAGLSGQADIVLGNVVGSNIFNVLFILGLSALVTPLVVSRRLVRIEVPLMIGLSGLVLILAMDGRLSAVDGCVLMSGLLIWSWVLIRQNRGTSLNTVRDDAREGGLETKQSVRVFDALLVAVGLGLLVFGSGWLVDSSVRFARALGVSELVIGLTIVSAGTSMPEVVTSLVAALKGERDIAVGNVLGSNIFNIMAVLGVGSIVATGGVDVAPAALRFDLPVMIAVAMVCLPIFFSGSRISRGEGALLFGYYIAYTVYVLAAATHHDALEAYSNVMLYFVLPMTITTISVIALRHLRRAGSDSGPSSGGVSQ